MLKNLYLYNSIPKALRKKWERRFWLMMFVELSAYFLVPFMAIFVRKEFRTDTMKRRAFDLRENRYTEYTAEREYLPKIFNWYNTHDNGADEYWYGMYDDFINDKFTQETYDNSWLLRYYNRVMWLWRNKAYGASYTAFGMPKGYEAGTVIETGVEDSGSLWVYVEIHEDWFKYESQIPVGKGKYRSVNIGWKANRSAPALADGSFNVMYANRSAWFSRKEY